MSANLCAIKKCRRVIEWLAGPGRGILTACSARPGPARPRWTGPLCRAGRISLPAYTAAFLRGYRDSNDLRAPDAAAVPLFQRLRIASRACYVTEPDDLAGVEAWMRRGFAG